MQSIWIDYKAQKFHALRFGTGSRLLIIFHGFAGRAEFFTHFADILSPHFDVVAVDLPYHGDTIWTPPTFKPHHIEQLLAGILSQTGHEKFSLMAHSMGGFVALKVYQLMPQKVEELILLAPGGIYKALPFNPYLFHAHTRRFLRLSFGSRFMPRIIQAGYKMRLLHRSFYEFIHPQFENENRRNRLFNSWVSLYYFHIQHEQIQALLHQYQTPICFFYGTKDKITPVKYAQIFCHDVPQAQIIMVEDNHFFIRSPLKEILSDWLNNRND
jgi:pimeloyl-ACP methyl ester carboxylesterase